jgi:molybdate transport system substrate-binding protein
LVSTSPLEALAASGGFVRLHRPGPRRDERVHFAGVLRGLGIVDAVRDKALLWPGGSAAEAVVRGQAELVVHQISEILAVPGVTLVGPLPAALQKVTTYAAGLAARSAAPEPARSLIAYLARTEPQAKLAAAGLDYRQ